jgi:uncharacterized protein YhbP (UPF0306 family)
MDQALQTFLKSQRLLVIASQDGEPWVCNVFYGLSKNGNLYFASPKDALHSQQIIKNPQVAFSAAWYNKDDHMDRKAVQGKGVCFIAESDEDITEGIALHNLYFPEFADRITFDWIKEDENRAVWVLTPSYVKFWNDELYGTNGTEEFSFL